MIESRLSPEKLMIVTICIVGLINATQMINLIMSPMSKQIGGIYPVYFSVSVIASVICLAGLWFLKRWAALAYGIVLICNQLVLLNMGFWGFTSAIIPVVIIGLLFKCWDKMA